MTNNIKHKRPKYSLQFKQDAASLVLQKAYSQQQAADHLDISLSALGRGVRAERKPSANESFTKKPSLSLANQDELIRLRKEIEQLRMERNRLFGFLQRSLIALNIGLSNPRSNSSGNFIKTQPKQVSGFY